MAYPQRDNTRPRARQELDQEELTAQDVGAVFAEYDQKFFHGVLSSHVELEWLYDMWETPRTCNPSTDESGRRFCTILVCEPILDMISREDLVERLVHQMIHAYCFVLGKSVAHDGPAFQEKMDEINRFSETNIVPYGFFCEDEFIKIQEPDPNLSVRQAEQVQWTDSQEVSQLPVQTEHGYRNTEMQDLNFTWNRESVMPSTAAMERSPYLEPSAVPRPVHAPPGTNWKRIGLWCYVLIVSFRMIRIIIRRLGDA